MDTPDKNQIATPISKFEDSPVFNFINSLSPIKTVKSVCITQAFSSLNFTLPSVFTSPHVANKESRFLRRHQRLEPSKPECSDNGNEVCTNEGSPFNVHRLQSKSSDLPANRTAEVSIGESSLEPPIEPSDFVVELPETFKYNCGNPDCDVTPCRPATLESLGANDPEKCVPEGHLRGIRWIEQKKEGLSCELDGFILDAADFLIFNSPEDARAFRELVQKSPDLGRVCLDSILSKFQQYGKDNLEKPQEDGETSSGKQEQREDPSSVSNGVEVLEQNEADQTLENTDLDKFMAIDPNENVEVEPVPRFHHGLRRRCLDFEMVGSKKNCDADAVGSSKMSSQINENSLSNGRKLITIKSGGDPLNSRHKLPAIGLHLNALATASEGMIITKSESLCNQMRLANMHISPISFSSPTSGQQSTNETVASAVPGRDIGSCENGVHFADACLYTDGEELNQSSPRKKRRKDEQIVEGESCKRCNCKKSKCLKLYCECFAAGVYCIEPCACQDCLNKPIHEDTVLATRKQIESRNPLAFAPKVIRGSDELRDESSKTPASARHKRGCNCKKSSCLKKYCECYQGGVGCSINCRCEGCKNTFGRKDGSIPAVMEGDLEEEVERYEGVDKASLKLEEQKGEDQKCSTLPTTPSDLYRASLRLALPSGIKRPRSSYLTIGSSAGLPMSTNNKLVNPSYLRQITKIEKRVKSMEGEIPEALQGNRSPKTGVKSISPNSKRVSPPPSEFGSSPGLRSGRRLILKSIPSFPSLTPQH